MGPIHNPIHHEFYGRVVLAGLLVSCNKRDSLEGLFPSKQELQAFFDEWVEEHKDQKLDLVSIDWDDKIFIQLARFHTLSHGSNIGISKGQVYLDEFAHQQICADHIAKARADLNAS